MPNYLIAVYRPNGFDASQTVDAAMRRDIDALNEEMVAAGVRVFVGGLRPPVLAKTLRRQSDGAVLLTDGPTLRAEEFLDGFWVLAVSDLDSALAWGSKAAAACRASVEVRPFY
jgi:hypothetical protein